MHSISLLEITVITVAIAIATPVAPVVPIIPVVPVVPSTALVTATSEVLAEVVTAFAVIIAGVFYPVFYKRAIGEFEFAIGNGR